MPVTTEIRRIPKIVSEYATKPVTSYVEKKPESWISRKVFPKTRDQVMIRAEVGKIINEFNEKVWLIFKQWYAT